MNKKPWEDKNGATDVDGFLDAFAKDDNTFWRMEPGHALNVIEELIERITRTKAEDAVLKSAKSYHRTFTFADGTYDNRNEDLLNEKTNKLIEAIDKLLEAEKKCNK